MFKNFLFGIYLVRLIISGIILIRGYYYHLMNNLYLCLEDYCWIYRVSNIGFLKRLVLRKILKITNEPLCGDKIRSSFLVSKKAYLTRNKYSLGGIGSEDIFRDIFVLKSPAPNEKGVIILNYGETYEALIAYFDVEKIFKNYYIVLEMSWSGCCDPIYLMFISPHTKVIVETPELDDYNFINQLKCNLIPIELGSGDWTDSERFTINENYEKKYDLIMVANWGKHKNHKILFKALAKTKTKNHITVLLVGFPWAHRNQKNIIDEFRKIVKKKKTNIELIVKENIPHSEVRDLMIQSKFSLLLSKKEGFNKGIMESLFCNIPAIVYDQHRGGAKEKINNFTGIQSSFAKLHLNIEYMLENYSKFKPREYVLRTSGSSVSTQKLNSFLKKISQDEMLEWKKDIVEKVNNPNFEYKNPSHKALFTNDYCFFKDCLIP